MKNPKQDPFYKILKSIINIYKIGGALLIASAFILLIVSFAPSSLYFVDAGALEDESDIIINTISAEDLKQTSRSSSNSISYTAARDLPPIDNSLTTKSMLYIPKINVNGEIHKGSDGYKELEKGIWNQTINNEPKDMLPMVFSSHRYGMLSWSNAFREENSFYNLDQLNNGDEVYVIWGQRKFKYKVTKKFVTDSLTNLNADLILYTCKAFRSEERIVVFAEAEW